MKSLVVKTVNAVINMFHIAVPYRKLAELEHKLFNCAYFVPAKCFN